MHQIIVVGSGATGVAAARALVNRGIPVLMLDVGNTPPPAHITAASFHEARRSDSAQFDYLIGNRFETCAFDKTPLNIKLRPPLARFVIQDALRFLPYTSENFFPHVSYAEGGLANVWGGVMYRYLDADLEHTPLTYAGLKPYFDELAGYIGLSGSSDDLAPFAGSAEGLLPPVKVSGAAAALLETYRHHTALFQRNGFFMGHPRLALLTVPHRGRPAYAYDNFEFFRPRNPSLYHPALTLEELKTNPLFEYKKGYLVQKFKEDNNEVMVCAQNLNGGHDTIFHTPHLILAAGTLNTTKIVLRSLRAYDTRLPILDTPITLTPFINLRLLGAPMPTRAFGLSQVAMVYTGTPQVCGAWYNYTAGLCADVLFDFPLSYHGNLMLTKYVLPALLVAQLFYPESQDSRRYLTMTPDGTLHIHYERAPHDFALEKKLIRVLRRFGMISHPSLCRPLPPGEGNHVSGTLPMKSTPAPLTVNPNCLLSSTQSVYIVDGSILPALSYKHHTFMLMANAMRVADRITL